MGKVREAYYSNTNDDELMINACINNNIKTVKEYKGDLNKPLSMGVPFLHYASNGNEYGDDDSIIKYLITNGVNINHKAFNGLTALHEACSHNKSFNVVKCLIDNGADVNAKAFNNNETPLSLACYYNHIEFIPYLLDNNADKVEIKSYWDNRIKELLLTY